MAWGRPDGNGYLQRLQGYRRIDIPLRTRAAFNGILPYLRNPNRKAMQSSGPAVVPKDTALSEERVAVCASVAEVPFAHSMAIARLDHTDPELFGKLHKTRSDESRVG